LGGVTNYLLADGSTGALNAYHYGSIKLATTSTGVDVTGTVTADGLTVDGEATFGTPTGVFPDEAILVRGNNGTSGYINGLGVGSSNAQFRIFADNTNNTLGSIKFDIRNRDRMLIEDSGDISFYDDLGQTPKFFWDASAESLGVGTSNPSAALDVVGDGLFQGVTGSATVNLVSTQNVSNAGQKVAFFGANRSDADEEMAYIQGLLVGNNGGTGNVQSGHLALGTSGTERLRIDSSGNVLVGKAVTNDATPGCEQNPNGYQFLTRDSGTPLYVRRNTNDGSFIDFRKDTAVVGSIGSNASAHLTMGSGDTGILFNAATDKIHPWNMTTQGIRDNAVDLGVASSRFKDLYLSGGVYLGGTGAANKLDDYEEGTWTATLGCTSNATTTTTKTGFYTKVGRQVTVSFRGMDNLDTTGLSGFLSVTLPFSCITADVGFVGGVSFNHLTYPADVVEIKSLASNGGTTAIFDLTGDGVGLTFLGIGPISSGTTDIAYFTLTYFTV
jgi:hypothetical protein